MNKSEENMFDDEMCAVRLSELEDQIQQKTRELLITKTQLECVETEKIELRRRLDHPQTIVSSYVCYYDNSNK